MENFGGCFVCVFEFSLFKGDIIYVLLLVDCPIDSPGWDGSSSDGPSEMAPQKIAPP